VEEKFVILLRTCLPLLLVAMLTVPAQAQSIFRDSRTASPGSTTSPPRAATAAPAIPAAPAASQPAAPTVREPAAPTGPGKPDATKPGGQIKRKPSRHPLPPGSVVAPPGSIILPPASVTPPRGRTDDKRRIHAVNRCNQQQIACNNGCNAHSHGTMRTICYRQCSSRYFNCVSRANTMP